MVKLFISGPGPLALPNQRAWGEFAQSEAVSRQHLLKNSSSTVEEILLVSFTKVRPEVGLAEAATVWLSMPPWHHRSPWIQVSRPRLPNYFEHVCLADSS